MSTVSDLHPVTCGSSAYAFIQDALRIPVNPNATDYTTAEQRLYKAAPRWLGAGTSTDWGIRNKVARLRLIFEAERRNHCHGIRPCKAVDNEVALLLGVESNAGYCGVNPITVAYVEDRYDIVLSALRERLGMAEEQDDEAVLPPAPTDPPPKPNEVEPAEVKSVDWAISTLIDAGRASDFTKSGKPRVRAIEKLLGYDITAAQRNAAWARIKAASVPEPEPEPKTVGVPASAVEVPHGAMVRAIREGGLNQLRHQFFDRKFKICSLEDFRAILKESDVDSYEYVAEFRDCDNFAAALFGNVSLKHGINNVGLVLDISGQHAYNAAVVYRDDPANPELVIVEPQTDKFVLLGEDRSKSEAYKATEGHVFWG